MFTRKKTTQSKVKSLKTKSTDKQSGKKSKKSDKETKSKKDTEPDTGGKLGDSGISQAKNGKPLEEAARNPMQDRSNETNNDDNTSSKGYRPAAASAAAAAAAATGVTFDDQVHDVSRITNGELKTNMMREKSILKDNTNLDKDKTSFHSETSLITRENTLFNRENTRFGREKSILKRENTKLERENTKRARFANERERTDISLKSRPSTSLDGQHVELVDCTESDEEFHPQFNSEAVLKGPPDVSATNNAKYDPDNARKPFFNQSFDKRRKDSIVVWPFANGTIALPKPPPRQPRPPTILESPGPEDKWVRINMGGSLFHTRVSTLSRCPGSRLTELVYNDDIPGDVEREYRFDRSPVLFTYILDYYRSGYLHMPQDVCAHALRYELQFWRLPDSVIAPCCWETYSRPGQDDSVAKEIDATDPPTNVDATCCGSESCRRQLKLMLEFPSSSWYAKLWAVIYVLLILASTASIILDTVRSCRVPSKDSSRNDPSETNQKQIMLNNTDSHPAIVIIEIITSLLFSVDLVLRFYCSMPCKKFINLQNTAEFLSLTAEWILLVLITFTSYWSDSVLLIVYKVCSFIRVLRMVRLFRLARSYRGLRIFLLAMAASVKELLLLLILMFMGIVIFATMIYYAEFSDPNNNFPDIPFSFWWAVVTMTTVGYGDIYPQSALGYAVGALCAVTGMLATGLPIPIIATNFQMYYSYSKIKERLRGRQQEKEEEPKKEKPVRLPKMKTFHLFDSLQSTFIGDLSRSSTFANDSFSPSPSDSGVFDDQTGEYIERKDRPRGAAKRNDKPSIKDYSKLRSDSVQSDAPPPPLPPGRSDTLFSHQPGTRDTTMLSLGTTNMDLLQTENTLTDVGSSSPRYPGGRKSGSAESKA